jgi:hypothetical protein
VTGILSVATTLELHSEVIFYKSLAVLLQDELDRNPCPEGYYYFGGTKSGCIPEQIVNPANLNSEIYLKRFHEWNEKQIQELGCGVGMNEMLCYHDQQIGDGLSTKDITDYHKQWLEQQNSSEVN